MPGLFTRGRWKCWDYREPEPQSEKKEILEFDKEKNENAGTVSYFLTFFNACVDYLQYRLVIFILFNRTHVMRLSFIMIQILPSSAWLHVPKVNVIRLLIILVHQKQLVTSLLVVYCCLL